MCERTGSSFLFILVRVQCMACIHYSTNIFTSSCCGSSGINSEANGKETDADGKESRINKIRCLSDKISD